MREGAKQRLIGATVIVALAVIFVPMLFEKKARDGLPSPQGAVPQAPTFDPNLKSEVFLGPGDSGVGGAQDPGLTESEPLALPSGGDSESAPESDALPPVAPESAQSESTEESAPGSGDPPTGPGEADAVAPPGAPRSAPAKGARDGMPSWVVQVASVATPEAAAALEGKLKTGGFPVFVEKAQVNGKLFYRVRVGPEVERARAEQTAARLRERYKVATMIKNYP